MGAISFLGLTDKRNLKLHYFEEIILIKNEDIINNLLKVLSH